MPVLKGLKFSTDAQVENCRQWYQATGTITSVTALSFALTSKAWEIRSGKWAKEVSEEQWEGFRYYLAKSKEVLESYTGEITCAGYYTAWQKAYLGLDPSKTKYFNIVYKAMDLDPTYYAIYEYTAYHLQPRWHGRKGNWQKFIIAMMRKEGVPADIYARAAMFFGKTVTNNPYKTHGADWGEAKKSFQAMVKMYPDSYHVKSVFLLHAKLNNDEVTSNQLIAQLDGIVDISVWKSLKKYNQMTSPAVLTKADIENNIASIKAAKKRLLGIVFLIIFVLLVYIIIRNR